MTKIEVCLITEVSSNGDFSSCGAYLNYILRSYIVTNSNSCIGSGTLIRVTHAWLCHLPVPIPISSATPSATHTYYYISCQPEGKPPIPITTYTVSWTVSYPPLPYQPHHQPPIYWLLQNQEPSFIKVLHFIPSYYYTAPTFNLCWLISTTTMLCGQSHPLDHDSMSTKPAVARAIMV